MSYAAFETQTAALNDILCAVNLLTWDSRTMMPAGGVEARGRQIATLVRLAREIATGDAMLAAIEAARAELGAGNDIRRHAVEEAAAGIAALSRIPPKLVMEAAALKTVGQHAWTKARAENDFAAFAPVPERSMGTPRGRALRLGY